MATKAQLEDVEQRLSAEIIQVSADVKPLRWAFGLLLGLVLSVLAMATAMLVKLLI
ncbi:MAG: hypothetical protein L0H73_01570 [Nitrococcus sp.]|nr:hypothetical protein [Nitrococcus sp.]